MNEHWQQNNCTNFESLDDMHSIISNIDLLVSLKKVFVCNGNAKYAEEEEMPGHVAASNLDDMNDLL